ncbi:MAG: hypothetical protein JO191_12830 [Mycobacteriaceae bacterium]|nr:hypothetical protein [Mycobacteriaceae bacterium]
MGTRVLSRAGTRHLGGDPIGDVMKRHGSALQRRTAVKMAGLFAGAGALMMMGATTLALSHTAADQSTAYVAEQESPTPTTPVASGVKPTRFVGGDLLGMAGR